MTNGYDRFLIKECGNDNATKYAKQYKKQAEQSNKTINSKKFNVNEIVVHKVTVNETKGKHYWFNINGTTYTCWGSGNNMDKIVTDLIQSST